MDTSSTNLRQADSNVYVEGKVSEVALERGTDKEGKEIIKGYVSVKTDDENIIRFNVYVNKMKKDGTENKTYAGIETVMNEYKSIAKFGEEEADCVKISGEVRPNTYEGRTTVQYRTNFFNRINNPEPKAEFKLEMYVKGVAPELNNEGEETGRVKIQGWMPTYNGIEPIDLICEADTADDALNYFEAQNTYQFWGDVIAKQKREVKKIAGGFGKAREEVKITYKNELICTGGSDPYEEDVTPNAPYDPQAIRAAIQEREDKLKSEQQNKANSNNRPSAAASGRELHF